MIIIDACIFIQLYIYIMHIYIYMYLYIYIYIIILYIYTFYTSGSTHKLPGSSPKVVNLQRRHDRMEGREDFPTASLWNYWLKPTSWLVLCILMLIWPYLEMNRNTY